MHAQCTQGICVLWSFSLYDLENLSSYTAAIVIVSIFNSCSLCNTDQDNSDGGGSPPAKKPKLSPQPNNTGTEKGETNSAPTCLACQLNYVPREGLVSYINLLGTSEPLLQIM